MQAMTSHAMGWCRDSNEFQVTGHFGKNYRGVGLLCIFETQRSVLNRYLICL